MMSMRSCVYALLFLVLVVNSDQFGIYVVTCSSSSCPFLCALAKDTSKEYRLHSKTFEAQEKIITLLPPRDILHVK